MSRKDWDLNEWTPAAILPNIQAKKAIEGGSIALAPAHDPRVEAFGHAHPKFKDFLSRFTDAFGVPLNPMVLIIRTDALTRLSGVEPLASFRDLVALSIIPYARALNIVYGGRNRRTYYSNSFWFYPWTLGRDNENLVMSTPALRAFHVVEEFHGQSSPELPEIELSEIDKPLFEVLGKRWERYYLGTGSRRADRVLFRSLNMAVRASQLPGGIDVTLYDLGTMLALSVSACEVLAHIRQSRPGLRKGAGLQQVWAVFENVSFVERSLGHRRYKGRGDSRVSLPG